MRIANVLVSAVLLASLPLAASAASISLVGIDTNVSADVLFTYTAGTGTVSIGITNTSPNNGGTEDPRLTGFGFNTPAAVTGFSLFTGPSGWSAVFDPNDINTPKNLGFFDLAASSGPNDGIASGQTANFSFVLTGSGLGALTEDSFLNLLSGTGPGTNQNTDFQSFFGRFQRVGPRGAGSDVAIPGTPSAPIPEPTSGLLFGAGMLIVARAARRRTP